MTWANFAMPLKTYQDEQPTLNLTPMIDVVFLLIIFFMVGTRFADNERKIKLELPVVGQVAALSSAPQQRIVHVLEDGNVKLEDRAVTLDQLTGELRSAKKQYADLSIEVRGDANGRFQNVAAVMAACRSAGIEDMAISVRIASAPVNRR
jgi:biopolymer transport protein ExbD